MSSWRVPRAKMTPFRRDFGLLLVDHKKDKDPRVRRGISTSAFDELRLWMREASDEDGLWAFGRVLKAMDDTLGPLVLMLDWIDSASGSAGIRARERAVRSGIFPPDHLQLILEKLQGRVTGGNLSELTVLHQRMALLRDGPKVIGGQLSATPMGYVHVLCAFEQMLQRCGMDLYEIRQLRRQNWPDRAEVIEAMGSSSGRRGRPFVSGGLPSLGKHR